MHTSIHIHYRRASLRALLRWWPQATLAMVEQVRRFHSSYPLIIGGAAKAVSA